LARLDLSRSWEGTVRMLTRNRQLVSALGGVFYFLPLFAGALAWLGSGIELVPQGREPNPEAIELAINAFLLKYWWVLLLIGLSQLVGSIAILRVLADPARPTVGDALRKTLSLLLPLAGAQLLSALAIEILPTLSTALLGNSAAGSFASLVIVPLVLFLAIRFSLVSPLVAIEEVRNPILAMQRSWQLTSGNSLRLLGYFALLILAGMLIFFVALMVVGLVLALLGEQGEQIGGALFFALALTVAGLVNLGVIASVHRRLSGDK